VQGEHEFELLQDAMYRDDIFAVERLLSSNPQLAFASGGPLNEPMLFVAARHSYGSAKLLTERGADVTLWTGGRSALHEAVHEGSVSTIRLFLDLGSAPNVAATGPSYLAGMTPLYIAAAQRHVATEKEYDNLIVANLLTDYGAQWDLHSAIWLNRLDIAERILEGDATEFRKCPFFEEA
jgi:ankyrin repeat protein